MDYNRAYCDCDSSGRRQTVKFAVISDIHSNYMALENALCCLDDMRRAGDGVDGIIFLGDYLTDFPHPQYTLRLLDECVQEFPCHFVRGNREDYLIRRRYVEDECWSYSSSSGSLLYTYENLTKKDLDVLESLSHCIDITTEGFPTITACHGSPGASKEWIMNRPQLIDKYTAEIAGDVLLCGHTHRGGVVEANGKRIIFCPSVGLPQDRRHGSRMLILESNGGAWRYRSVPVGYDKQKMAKEFHSSGLYEKAGVWAKCIIKSMFDEHDHAARCVALAWRKASADGYEGSQVLPEKYWLEAAHELGLA